MNIKNILICGGGLMGKNIAFVMTQNPAYQVSVYDLYPTDVFAGIRTSTKQLVERGVITEAELEERLSRIEFTNDIDSELVSRADLSSRPCSRICRSSARPSPSWKLAAVPTAFSAPTPPS